MRINKQPVSATRSTGVDDRPGNQVKSGNSVAGFLFIGFLVSAALCLVLTNISINMAFSELSSADVLDGNYTAKTPAPQDQLRLVSMFASTTIVLGLICSFSLIYLVARPVLLGPIASLHQSEARLRESESRTRRLALVAERSSDLVIIYDANGLILWVNAAFERTTGHKRADVRGRKPSEFLNGQATDQATSDRIAASIKDGKPITTQIVNYSKTGREYLVELNITPVHDDDGVLINFVAVERDITDRQVAQRRLNEALQALKSPFCIYDRDERLVASNDAYAAMVEQFGARAIPGVSFSDMTRKTACNGMLKSASKSPEQLAEWRKADGVEQIVTYGDGRTVLLRDTRTPSGDYVTVRSDVTELIEIQKKTEAAAQAKSRFLANIGHEIRTPMTGVISMAELLMNGDLNEEQFAGLELIVQSGEALLTIINDILDFSKIEAGKMSIRPSPFDLVEATEDVCALLSTGAENKGLHYSFRFDPNVPRQIIGDMGRFRQIITNLVGNAIKFTESGSVTIRLGGDLELGGANARIWLEVEDTGIGVSSSDLNVIFGAFEQAEDGDAKKLQEGTGLGLSISHQLARMMGGTLIGRSSPGQGSVFRLDLTSPVDEAAAPLHRPLAGKNIGIIGSATNAAPLIDQLSALGAQAKSVTGAGATPTMDLFISVLEDGATAPPPDLSACTMPFIVIPASNISPSADVLANFPAGRTRLLRRPVRTGLLGQACAAILSPQLAPRFPTSERRCRPRAKDAPLILIAEDSNANSMILKALLADQGYRLLIKPLAEDAIAAYIIDSPAAVIMDLNMPDMSGVEATRRIRAIEAMEGRLRVPVIAATADASEAVRHDFAEAGADDFMLKPFRANRVRARLRHWAPISAASQIAVGNTPDLSAEFKTNMEATGFALPDEKFGQC
jgi:PAS domain S-box-containing protein